MNDSFTFLSVGLAIISLGPICAYSLLEIAKKVKEDKYVWWFVFLLIFGGSEFIFLIGPSITPNQIEPFPFSSFLLLYIILIFELIGIYLCVDSYLHLQRRRP